ncbi:AAA family ATPase [Chitinophaga filiformis]|uniref:Predicted ATPase n=1 Tax=Chitinophaga filiformis TaxID=104663 RepID=A0A1G7MH19_CHIFI|nr:AAA family ATPase [Chitinophaga filiformis]SDF61017.1 Predicted ATPase [Chitinophaga filiformis]
MSKIRVRNFGPIKGGLRNSDNGGWIDINKVTVFIGNQGTGKSTLAKLISTFTWMEKALTRGDYTPEYFTGRYILGEYLEYHNISRYFKGNTDDLFSSTENNPQTEIEYEGYSYSMKFINGQFAITKNNRQGYHLPQIMYHPAERNVSSYSQDFRRNKTLPGSLIELVTQFLIATQAMNDRVKLPINNLYLVYDEAQKSVNLAGYDYSIYLHEASSGIQSLVPLYLISRYFANSVKISSENREQMSSEEQIRFRREVAAIHANVTLTEEQRRSALSVAAAKYNKTAFINIVEEPEQNLFPSSQWEILKSLLEFNNMSTGNKLIMTTHSPYVINDLMLAVKANYVYGIIEQCGKTELLDEIEKIVPRASIINSEQLSIYEMDDEGNILELGKQNGLPSDENYLNEMLEQSNEQYSQLLRIENKCR